jgi:RNA polymerase sigma-70 factor, ECF subfamily
MQESFCNLFTVNGPYRVYLSPRTAIHDGLPVANVIHNMFSDESFLDQLKDGLPAAYVVLVERFEGPLYRFFLCDHRNHHTAQEQTAETFAQLVRSLPRMRGGYDQLRAYVFATARHVQQRRWRKRKGQPLPLAEALGIGDPRPSPAKVASDREQVERVLNAISHLDDPLRNVLLLRFVEDCSIDEVAEALEMPIGTVKSHIHRGRMRLKQICAETEYEK